MHTPLTPAAATISAHAPEPLQSVATARNEVSNRDLLAELCDRAGCAVVNTYLQKPAHRKVTYHAWGAAYPTSDNLDHQVHRELDLVLATDRRLVTDVLSLQHMPLGKSNHFLQEIRLRADQLIVRRQPKAASRRIGAWAWRDESLASTCLASVMHARASYLATCPSHVHEYAPRNIETARFPVELEIYIDGSFTKGDDLPAGWGFTVVSPFPYGEATPTWDSIRGRLLFIVQRRYGPVTTDPQAFHYVGAHYQRTTRPRTLANLRAS